MCCLRDYDVSIILGGRFTGVFDRQPEKAPRELVEAEQGTARDSVSVN